VFATAAAERSSAGRDLDAVGTFVNNVVMWLRTGPALDVLKLGAEDALPACGCNRCRSLNPADWYLGIANRIADSAAAVNPKLMILSPVGYPPLQLPPKNTKPQPRLHAMYEHWGRNQTVSLDDPRYPADAADKWRAAYDGRMSVLLYYSGLMTSPAVPPPYTRTFAGDRAFMLRAAPEGFYAIQFPEATWWMTGFNNYLMGQAGYDKRIDPGAILDDYARAYFGPAAAPMLRYYRDLADDVAFSYRVARGAKAPAAERAADGKRLEALGRVLQQAEKAAVGQAPYDYRVSKVLALHDYLQSLQASRDHRAVLIAAIEARRTGAPAPSREEIDQAIASEEAILAEDKTRAQDDAPRHLHRPDGLADRPLGRIQRAQADARGTRDRLQGPGRADGRGRRAIHRARAGAVTRIRLIPATRPGLARVVVVPTP
jgi:hypothetical protein